MVKILYRSRKYQINILCLMILLYILYFISRPNDPELEVTRRYIEKKLQEALKEEKGTGCEIPHLDPFAKEVIQFDTENPPKVVCEGQDWVKCYLHECRVVKEILDTTEDIHCDYRDIIHESDAKYIFGKPTTVSGSNPYVLIVSDHVKVKCTGKCINSKLFSKWTGHGIGYHSEVMRRPPGDGGPYNVLMFGFDSTSKNGFIRKMPKSYRFITEELSATVLNGYNIVGDGTHSALFPLLTGKTEYELPDVRKLKSQDTLDRKHIIFNKAMERGYRTAYFEDMPEIGTFQQYYNGFKHQPADHYLRSFFLEEAKTKSFTRTSKYCVGGTPRFKLMINITEQFFKLPGSRFGFTFIADISHDNFNVISTADDDTVSFLRRFKRNGHLENTILIVMGDHGARYSKIRETLQGSFEEKLPLMAILLPRKLTKARPGILANLVANADALTTPHDIHETLLDALDMTQNRNFYKIPGTDLCRGLSLFEPIPRTRTCSEAGIEPHWCSCFTWEEVSQHDPLYSRVANTFVDFINSLTEPLRSLCAIRTLSRTEWVWRSRAKTRLNAGREADNFRGFYTVTMRTVENYQVKLSVDPGNGIFEVTAIYVVEEDKFIFDIRDISRVNTYNGQPSCIRVKYPSVKKYCYCNNYTTLNN